MSGFGYFRGEPINLKPKSGEGPPAWLLKEGAFTIEVTATAASGAQATAIVKGKGDPGYGAAAEILTPTLTPTLTLAFALTQRPSP